MYVLNHNLKDKSHTVMPITIDSFDKLDIHS